MMAACRRALLVHPVPAIASAGTAMGGPMSRMVAWAAGLALAAGPAGARAAPELLFQAEAQVLTGVCTGQPVRLEGNHDTLTLTGLCGSLLVKGFGNTVRLGIVPGGPIRVEGSANRVQFTVRGAAPAVVVLGPDNDVSPQAASAADPPVRAAPALATPPPAAVPGARPGSASISDRLTPPAAPPHGPLVLAGDDQQRLEDCAGRDVTVTGNRSAYVIRGGCKSLTVRGDLLAVQAELASATKVTVSGRGSIVSWAVKGRGRPPAAIVRGPGSRVQRAETIGGQPDH